ncbi:MAG: YraN family protein [Alphaproteobacteria bacterium]
MNDRRRPGADSERRQAAQRRGRWAEHAALLWLRLKFYRILDRNLRLRGGELDLVARRGRTLVFVEVKRRADLGASAEAITARQRQRIRRAAEEYLQHRPKLRGLDARFDALLIVPGRAPRHIVDAWRE